MNNPAIVDMSKTTELDVAANDGGYTLVVVRDTEELSTYIPPLEKLVEKLPDPNVFYEPWMLMPALAQFGKGEEMIFLMVFAGEGDVNEGELVAFFPLVLRRYYRGLRMSNVSLWQHPYCFLSSPLLLPAFASEAVDCLVKWFAGERNRQLLILPQMRDGGVFDSKFCAAVSTRNFAKLCTRYPRSAWQRGAETFDEYLDTVMSKKSRRECRRLQRKLSEQGQMQWKCLDDYACVDDWVDEFLRLESSGWKGQSGTAISAHGEDVAFFRAVINAAATRERLQTLAIYLDGRPVAMIAVLLAGDGAYGFKMAYDEQYRRYGPGVMLMTEYIRNLYSAPQPQWLDSCAKPDHELANRMLVKRLAMQNILVAKRRSPAAAMLLILPVLSWLKKHLVGVSHGQ